MNLNHLAILLAIAEEKTITKAADRLMISQPAVSKQIRILERNLGVQLLEREARKIRLTYAGQLLAGYGRRIFDLDAEAERAIREIRGLSRGRLAIGASTTIGTYLLPEVFVQFRKKHPQIETTFEIGSSPAIYRRLCEGALDVAFTETPPSDQQLVARTFASEQLVAIAKPGRPIFERKKVTARTLCKEPFVVRATGSDTKSFVERALSHRGLEINAVMAFDTTEAIKRAVAAGIGVAIVSHLSISLELKARILATLQVSDLRIRRPLYQVRRKSAPTDGPLESFMQILNSHCSRDKSLSS